MNDPTKRAADCEEPIPWVGEQSLSWFYNWCRDHGIAGSAQKFKDGIIAGVFAPGAIAVPNSKLGWEDRYHFYIFPKRLEEWAKENAIDYR